MIGARCWLEGRKEKFITGRNIDEGLDVEEVGSEAGGSGLH